MYDRGGRQGGGEKHRDGGGGGFVKEREREREGERKEKEHCYEHKAADLAAMHVHFLTW